MCCNVRTVSDRPLTPELGVTPERGIMNSFSYPHQETRLSPRSDQIRHAFSENPGQGRRGQPRTVSSNLINDLINSHEAIV